VRLTRSPDIRSCATCARGAWEAARQLCNGAPDILTIALNAGYGSHEAFTRAFRDQFGLTPEQARGQDQVATLSFQGR
jgi:AraC family transcriptional regulator